MSHLSFDWLQWQDGALHWLDSHHGLMRWRPGGEPVELTPPGFRVGGGVHGYGGGSYLGTPGAVWCVGDGGLYQVNDDNTVTLMVEGAFGDLVLGAGELLAVREDATGDALVAVSLDGDPEPRVLAEAAGFFGAPRPTDGMVAWTWWSARDMPWDGCEVWVAAYEPGGQIGDPMRVAGGPDESAIEPRWGPDGMLYFMSDRTGWWNLYRHDGTAVAPVAAECAAAPWELGYASYCFLDDGRIVMVVREGPEHRLVVVDDSGTVSPVAVPYTSIKPCLSGSGSSVALVGSSPTLPQQVAVLRLDDGAPPLEVVAGATAVAGGSTPTRLDVPVDGGVRQVVALVYPPAGAPHDWSAPLIVRAHPGPTASIALRLDPQVQYFTARGFAVVDVDYTGSTGYGRAFREALYGRWGIDDVADCVAVAEHLVASGRAMAGQVFVRGASAGGYTALQAVSQDGPFAAAVAVSAVVDPDRWAETAPRFQRPHAARLRGGAGAVTAASLRTPVLLIHGTEDAVVAADDVVELADGLRERDAAHELLLLKGVGHDVAGSEDASAALEAELRLYQRIIDAR
ncbi:prolyl oligopeptidase family serine peptidase [Dactylosporangium sp. NPDC049525]|uniref:S9 family peptidase n=1 Tax=Dactylosporangium sp. NPDC049525 TaxID=3154730 RepID=UPI00341D9684